MSTREQLTIMHVKAQRETLKIPQWMKKGYDLGNEKRQTEYVPRVVMEKILCRGLLGKGGF